MTDTTRKVYTVEEFESQIHVGEATECPTCGYGTNRMGQERCDNDGTPLRVVTWKDRAGVQLRAGEASRVVPRAAT